MFYHIGHVWQSLNTYERIHEKICLMSWSSSVFAKQTVQMKLAEKDLLLPSFWGLPVAILWCYLGKDEDQVLPVCPSSTLFQGKDLRGTSPGQTRRQVMVSLCFRCSWQFTSVTVSSTSQKFLSPLRQYAETWWICAKSLERATAIWLKCGVALVWTWLSVWALLSSVSFGF